MIVPMLLNSMCMIKIVICPVMITLMYHFARRLVQGGCDQDN